MIRIVDASREDVFSLLARRHPGPDAATAEAVRAIIEDVRQRGDAALRDNVRRFDCPGIVSLQVDPDAIRSTWLPENQEEALELAAARIGRFHRRQMERLGLKSWEQEGVGQRISPLRSVGVYVPGGRAAYPSSVLMNAIPAAVAGVESIIVASPPSPEGSLPRPVLAALRHSSVRLAFMVGGAAAVAALAIGTESVPRVDKVVGPGNRFVNEAKRQLWGEVGIDGYAGPSEVAVLADESAAPLTAAADLLTQVEHAEDNAGFLVCVSQEKLDEILVAAEALLAGAEREATMRQALSQNGLAIVARDMEQAAEIIDAIAPEHLSVLTTDADRDAARIRNAGCILMGESTPESAADWVIGPSHTLPTAGGARFAGPLNVLDFMKVQTVAKLSRKDLMDLQPAMAAFGEMEGLPMHARAAMLRRSD